MERVGRVSNARIAVTGARGLVGTALCSRLRRSGFGVHEIDLRHPQRPTDTRLAADVTDVIAICDGVIHLAAVSRVAAAECDPASCWATNVEGTQTVLQAAMRSSRRPWLVFASSREVYGQPCHLPVAETDPIAPLNVYGRAKVIGEAAVANADLRTAIVRLSNVYGSIDDHVDRVVPAFVRAATSGAPLRVEGAAHAFDFTHVDDVVDGLLRIVAALADGERLPPIHLVTGQSTTLGALATLAIELAGSNSVAAEAPPRTFDVSSFVGDGTRAHRLLGWKPLVSLRQGLRRLVDETRQARADKLASQETRSLG